MTDFERRGEIPPPKKLDEIEVSNWAVFVAALGILAERARLARGASGRNHSTTPFLAVALDKRI